jgi:integrase
MARQSCPFTLYRRSTSKKNRYLYYAKIKEELGEYRVSTGCTSRAAAENWVLKHLAEREEEKKRNKQKRKQLTFGEFAKDFWEESSRYVRSKRARNYSFSRAYLKNATGNTRNHLIPRWGKHPLGAITACQIDDWIVRLVEEGNFASSTINKLLQQMRIILDQACYERLLDENPAKYVRRVKHIFKKRGVLSPKEVRQLFADPGIWKDFRHYAINVLTLSTGMRLGEIRGLLVTDVNQDHISVRHSWEDHVGLKEPKWGSVRDIPITFQVYQILEKVIMHTRPHSLLFYGKDLDSPMSKSYIEKSFYQGLHSIGISEEERKERNITFHSHRHTLNTLLRSSGVSDAKIRAITGHKSAEMTDLYTHFQMGDLKEVLMTQQIVIG